MAFGMVFARDADTKLNEKVRKIEQVFSSGNSCRRSPTIEALTLIRAFLRRLLASPDLFDVSSGYFRFLIVWMVSFLSSSGVTLHYHFGPVCTASHGYPGVGERCFRILFRRQENYSYYRNQSKFYTLQIIVLMPSIF